MAQLFGGAAHMKLFGLLVLKNWQWKLKFVLHVKVKSCDLDEYLIWEKIVELA